MSVPTVILEDLSAMDVLRMRAKAAIKAARRAVPRPAVALPGIIALFDQGVVSITNFATAVMIGRVCGKAELGVYSLAWTLITVATGIISTLISAPYTVFGPQLGLPRAARVPCSSATGWFSGPFGSAWQAYSSPSRSSAALTTR